MSPDIRKHRGAHPEDAKLFSNGQVAKLREAVAELSWLLTREYSIKAAVKLVGDKFALHERQRLAVARAGCSDQSRERRKRTCARVGSLKDETLLVDGFNLLITIEAALSGGLLLVCRDRCIRDLSSVHGSYRSVDETAKAIVIIGEAFAELAVGHVEWIFDRPISNSGRLAQRLRDFASQHERNWSVEVAFNPDAEMAASKSIVISSDGPLLDRVQQWTNFSKYLIDNKLAGSWLVDLS